MPDSMLTDATSSTAKIAAALAAAQKNFAPIPKDREVTVVTKRGSYKFRYATLDAIRSATMPALAEQQIAVVQGMIEHGRGYAIETRLLHASGEELRNVTPMFVSGRRTDDGRELPPSNQELGSAQSYARRYGLSALLCITADEDDDGNTADGNHIEDSGERVPYVPRQSSANGRRMAADDQHLVDTGRAKGTTANGSKRSAAEKAKEWTDKAIQTLNLGDATVDGLSKFWSEHTDKIEWLETHAADQHERFVTAYDNAAQAARAKVAV